MTGLRPMSRMTLGFGPALLATLLLAAPAYAQSGRSYLGFPAASPLTGLEIFGPLQQAGSDRTTTANALKAFTSASPAFTGAPSLAVPYPDLNVTADAFRVAVGNLPLSMELGAFGHASNGGLVAAMVIPAGPYTGPDTWPDCALCAYVLSNNTTKAGAALYTLAGIGVSGAFVEGGNISSVNCSLFDPSCTPSGGKDFRFQTSFEVDTNLYSIGGAQPTGPVKGIVSQLNGTVQTTSSENAFECIGSPYNVPPSLWKACYATENGAGTIGMILAAGALTGPSNSQSLELAAFGAGGTVDLVTMFEDSLGGFNITTSPGGATFTTGSPSYPQTSLSQAVAGGPSGMRLRNTATAIGTSENLLMQTGSANSFATLQLVDAGQVILTSGPANTGISITSDAGGIALTASTVSVSNGLHAPSLPVCGTGGLVTGDVCKSSSNVIQVTP